MKTVKFDGKHYILNHDDQEYKVLASDLKAMQITPELPCPEGSFCGEAAEIQ